jgi:hypothetical protein
MCENCKSRVMKGEGLTPKEGATMRDLAEKMGNPLHSPEDSAKLILQLARGCETATYDQMFAAFTELLLYAVAGKAVEAILDGVLVPVVHPERSLEDPDFISFLDTGHLPPDTMDNFPRLAARMEDLLRAVGGEFTAEADPIVKQMTGKTITEILREGGGANN